MTDTACNCATERSRFISYFDTIFPMQLRNGGVADWTYMGHKWRCPMHGDKEERIINQTK